MLILPVETGIRNQLANQNPLSWGESMAKPKIFIKQNKNQGICDITLDGLRVEPCKRALSHFQGRDIRLHLKDCLYYTRLCIGSAIHPENDAWEREIERFHYAENHKEEEV